MNALHAYALGALSGAVSVVLLVALLIGSGRLSPSKAWCDHSWPEQQPQATMPLVKHTRTGA